MYELVKVNDSHELQPGTHIAVQRPFEKLHWSLKGLYFLVSDKKYYYHHGVFLGDSLKNGESPQVIHYSGQTPKDAKPCLIDINEFRKLAVDGNLYMAQYNDRVSVLPVEETLQGAEDVLSGEIRPPKFDVISHNCESLATWLKTGREYSKQGMDGITRATTICTFIGAGVGAILGENTIATATGVFIGCIFPSIVSKVASGNSGCSGCCCGST